MLYNNKKMEGKIMAKMIYLIRWFDGIRETKEICEPVDTDEIAYIRENAEDYELVNIDKIITYQNGNGKYPSLQYVDIDELISIGKELAYPSEDRDDIVEALDLRVADEYKDYEDSGNIIGDYIENIKEKIYQMI